MLSTKALKSNQSENFIEISCWRSRSSCILAIFTALVLTVTGLSTAQVTYSAGWTSWTGTGPWGGTLHNSSTANATATILDTGTEAFVIHKMGADCGIMQVVVDGNSSTMKEIDAYSATVLWNKKSVIASGLTNGPHTIVVTVTGRKNTAASGALVQIVDKWILGRGIWTTEKAWAWYKGKPWIVGWNYMPTTCVNAIEWWQDESHVSDSSINRELGLGEQLGYNAIMVYLPYIVWVKDSAYLKNRFSRFLAIAASRHFSVSPIFFDDVGFKTGEPTLGDQGAPNPNVLMSQWTMDPGPTLSVATAERPRLKRYIQDFIRTYGQDSRILMWNLYNEPGNTGMGARTFPLVELAFQWAREIGPSQPLTCSEWGNYVNPWPYDLSDICSFHGYTNNAGLSSAITNLHITKRPIICTEWLARGNPGTDILKDLPLFKRMGVGCYQWSLINGQMHCERSWSSFGSYNNPWFHDCLYNSGKPYRADEVDAIRKNFAHKTINWAAGATDGTLVTKNGCTDPRYSQYDSMATVDNGSCSSLLPALVVPGCLDSTSKNYNPLATQSNPAMCNAVPVLTTPAVAPKEAQEAAFRFLGNSQIRIFGQGVIRVELFSPNGVMVWHGKGTGPCIVNVNSGLKNGVYFVRLVKNGGSVGVSPLFRVSDNNK
jgi:hypothetical protein